MNGLKGFLQKAVAVFLPARCAFCGGVTAGGEDVCPSCAVNLPLVRGDVCPKCGRERAFCNCTKQHYAFARCVAPFYYEGTAKRGVLRLKFYHKRGAAAVFAAYAQQIVRREYADVQFDVVTAVPLSRSEIKKRGFNQSAVFARELSRLLGIPYGELLAKPYDTRPQHSCKAGERWGNVYGAFTAPGGAEGKTVLLADDIATTGATLSECAKVLRLAGASQVYCAVIACVKKPDAP